MILLSSPNSATKVLVEVSWPDINMLSRRETIIATLGTSACIVEEADNEER